MQGERRREDERRLRLTDEAGRRKRKHPVFLPRLTSQETEKDDRNNWRQTSSVFLGETK